MMYRVWYSKSVSYLQEGMARRLSTVPCVSTFEFSQASNIWCLECKENAMCLSRNVMKNILDSLREVEVKSGDECKGVILFNRGKCFLPHFDYSELENPTRESFMEYWFMYQNLFQVLQTFPAPVCVVASEPKTTENLCLLCACDFRVLKAVPISSPPQAFPLCSPWMAGAIAHILGFRTTEYVLTGNSTMHTSSEKWIKQIADATADTVEEGIECCVRYINKINKCPSLFPFWVCKDNFRKSTVAPLCTPELRQFDAECLYESLNRFLRYSSTKDQKEGTLPLN